MLLSSNLHYQPQQPPQENLAEMDPELARLHREGACPFFAAAQKAKSLGVDDVFNDTSQIPLEEAVDIFRSLSMDETTTGTFPNIFFISFDAFDTNLIFSFK